MSFQEAFASFPELESERLVLRRVEAADAPTLFTHFATLRADRFWDLEHRSVEDARQHIDLIHTWYEEQRLLWWAVTLKGESEVFGSCSLYDFERESRAEIGYWLSATQTGKGNRDRSGRAGCPLRIDHLDLHRIQASCHPQNHAAVAVVRRAGFREEGLLREYEPGRTGWRDCLMFSLLKGKRAPQLSILDRHSWSSYILPPIAPVSVFQRKVPMSSNVPVRVGQIGCGHWASSSWLPYIGSCPDAEIVALCDLDLGRARQLREEFLVTFRRIPGRASTTIITK